MHANNIIMEKILALSLSLIVSFCASAADYYLSPTGSDANSGKSRSASFATLGKAQSVVRAGDNVYILPGIYSISESHISKTDKIYKIVFDFNQKGTEGSPIRFIGMTENGRRPVFDMSNVNPAGYRVTAFYVTGQYLTFRNFEVVGIKVNITTHTQSENFRIRGGHHNTFDNIACHDGMGIGFYLTNNSHHNLFLNCDSYNNYDPVSENGIGGQNDGFGCHVSAGNEGNIFIGCRAWNNSDDGYDLINCYSPVNICYSIAYKNGYDAEGNKRQDGNGFKSGGYGMHHTVTIGNVPMHEVRHCIAVQNKSNGFYSNHHLGRLRFSYNTAVENGAYNYNMTNRKNVGVPATDVPGYGHELDHNQSHHSRDKHVWNFYYNENNVCTDKDVQPAFSPAALLSARDADGMLAPQTQELFPRASGTDFIGYKAAIGEAKKVSGAFPARKTAIRAIVP